jgi:hypothetical protein
MSLKVLLDPASLPVIGAAAIMGEGDNPQRVVEFEREDAIRKAAPGATGDLLARAGSHCLFINVS